MHKNPLNTVDPVVDSVLPKRDRIKRADKQLASALHTNYTVTLRSDGVSRQLECHPFISHKTHQKTFTMYFTKRRNQSNITSFSHLSIENHSQILRTKKTKMNRNRYPKKKIHSFVHSPDL